MEGFSNISTSQDKSYNYSNTTSDCPVRDGVLLIAYVVTCVIICIGLPLTLMAICAVFSLVRNNHVAPIYVINLLISDLIQFCCMIVKVSACEGRTFDTALVYFFGLVASVCFMVCIALERYLVIACPLWYRFKRPVKTSVVVCVLVWVLTLVYLITLVFCSHYKVSGTIFAASLLVPLPLFFCFLGGTLKALSASRVPSDDKRQIVGILVLVLLIYILLFLPTSICLLTTRAGNNSTFRMLSSIFIKLSPLADLTLYVFIRRGTTDKLLASVCHCRMGSNDSRSEGETYANRKDDRI
uniref:mas-related G-protein coupled receptor member B4-like isoform X1 n=1 Tax=Scatophagus argus TaxID=75038 RepID=UPI001ED7FB48|nr:mas-related G-protein coupled receptor member B4-like isoform X1 [Scatophagus argus]XP_046258167.1 mas-related G-protein coupled receptor member B4-like isoform X1 [Scatophagus argus]